MVKLSLIALGAVAIAAAGLLALTCRPVRESPQGSGR
jgi:hypothetical protein